MPVYSNGFIGKSATMSIPAQTSVSSRQSHLPRSFTDHNVAYSHQTSSGSTRTPSPPSPSPPHSFREEHNLDSSRTPIPYLRSDIDVPYISSSYSDVYPATSSHFQDSPFPVRVDRHCVPSEGASSLVDRPSSIFHTAPSIDRPAAVHHEGTDRSAPMHIYSNNHQHSDHVLLPRPVASRPVDQLSSRPEIPGFARYSTRRRTRPLAPRGVWGTVGCTRRQAKHTDSLTQAAMRESAV